MLTPFLGYKIFFDPVASATTPWPVGFCIHANLSTGRTARCGGPKKLDISYVVQDFRDSSNGIWPARRRGMSSPTPKTVSGCAANLENGQRTWQKDRLEPRFGSKKISVKLETKMIKLFITGGTFDKEYNELNGSLYFKETHIPEMLKLGRSRIDVDVRTLMMIDSLDMTDADREIILDQCRKAESQRIVITHGTDTMPETARLLGQANLEKTIVLTGAIVPYKFGSSDGLFNLGAALAFAQSLPAGVFIAMNGRFFAWDNVRKNRDKGEFEELG